jgi:hypothetical protein
MASLEEAFKPVSGNIPKENTKNNIFDSHNPNCGNPRIACTNDGNKTCSCSKCNHIFWKHGVTKFCNCNDCRYGKTKKNNIFCFC